MNGRVYMTYFVVGFYTFKQRAKYDFCNNCYRFSANTKLHTMKNNNNKKKIECERSDLMNGIPIPDQKFSCHSSILVVC